MNEVNKTLYIPLYGKAKVSRQGIILNDPYAEAIWKEEAFPIHGKSRSKWLAYNMAMRARVFDDWTDSLLQQNEDALVLHIGCGLDSRYMRIKSSCSEWIDCDLPDVIEARKKHFQENETYHTLDKKYRILHILMDVYTDFGVKASNYKNPVKDVGVTKLYGINDIDSIISGLRIRFVKEHSFTPKALINELAPPERLFFKMLFTGKLYRKIYRLYELEA